MTALDFSFEFSALISGRRVMFDFGGGREAVSGDYTAVLQQRQDGCKRFLRVAVSKNAGQPEQLTELRWKLDGEFLLVPGPQARLYREGWSMPTPCGVAKWGDTEFQCNPEYSKYCYTHPERYNRKLANFFESQYVTVLGREDRSGVVLAGFVTSADMNSHFEVTLGRERVEEFDAVCDGDNRLFETGDSVLSEELTLFGGDNANAVLDEFAGIWGERMHARKRFDTPRGWCSWYYYFEKITQKDVEENVDFLAAHRDEYPLEYFQIDDGYQADNGAWLTTKMEFPAGLKNTVDYIGRGGFKPALWLAPFIATERSEIANRHPEYLLHDKDGNILWSLPWRNSRVGVLDGTHPGVQAFFKDLFGTLREWGVKYVKLDFMVYGACEPGAVYYDRKATRAQALRRGIAAIREGFGEENFILSCTTPHGPAVGLVDAHRVSTDITPYWGVDDAVRYAEAPSIPNVCRNQIMHNYMHRKLFINDPDVHIARRDNNKLTENEVVLWTSALWLVGGLTMLTDRFVTLDSDRAELSKLLLQRTDAFGDVRPQDIFERKIPAVWAGSDRDSGRKVYGLFNFEDCAQTIAARTAPDAEFSEYWSKSKARSDASGVLAAELAPHSCKLFFEC